jgi:outer membrane assembly lipoprotein YfiO
MKPNRVRAVNLGVAFLPVWAALAVWPAAVPAYGQEAEWKDGNWVTLPVPAKGTPAGEAALIRQEVDKGSNRAAVNDAEKFIKAYPLDPYAEEVLMLAGRAEMARGRYYQAYELFEKQILDFPSGRYFERSLQYESDCAEAFLSGKKRIIWNIFYVPAQDDGLEILKKIVEHAPGSLLAERSLLRTADYHYQQREYPEAIKSYDKYLEVFGHNEKASYAMLQAARASLAWYRGPEFDDRPLLEARQRYVMFAERFPLQADRADVPRILEQIRLSLARKAWTTAAFYERIGRRDAAKYCYRLVLAQYPQTEWATQSAAALLRLGEPTALPTTGPSATSMPATYPTDLPELPPAPAKTDNGSRPRRGGR